MHNLEFIVPLEIGMPIALTYVIVLILRHRENLELRHGAVIFLVLAMMGSMFDAMSFYIDLGETFVSLFIAILIAMFIMGGIILYLIYFAIGRPFTGLSFSVRRLIVGFIVWNEVSLGIVAYSMGFGGQQVATLPSVLGGTSYILYMFSAGVNTYLFVAPMSAEMVIVMVLTKARGLHLYMLLALLSMALLSPTLLGNTLFVHAGTLLTTAFMILFMVILFERITKKKDTIKWEEKSQLTYLFFAFAFMSFGIFFGTIFKTPFLIAWLLYACGMSVTMGVYFNSVLPAVERPEKKRLTPGWVKSPAFMFSILLSSLVAEWFLSASLLVQEAGTPFSMLPALHMHGGMNDFIAFSNGLGGVSSFTAPSVLVDVIYVIGAVTDSPWFWTIMGIEMSSLVIIRMRSTHWKGKRWNLALALAAFWAWTVWFQGAWWTNIFGTSAYALPFWPNTGELGPVYPVFALSIILSYVIFAVLALLFGRRSYCSTLCPSAIMYGGTLGQGMISYNYESKTSRKHIGSRYRGSVLTVAYNSWFVAIIFSGLSYYSVTSVGNLTIYGLDASVFYSTFIWNFLWYVFFVSIPFVGMSPCRRYGWCSTGTFVGFFSKLGFFKVKAHDSQTCVTCPTKDCVTNCEVGLGDLAKQFIQKGEFQSSKCVGAGSCVQACPYDNIYFYDVRDMIKERKRGGAETATRK